MNLQRLLYFVTVVEERSFTRAAESLGVSQPALSRQITVLEGELGATLLERSAGGIVPTTLGRDVLVEARLTLASARRVSEAVKDSMQLEMGRLEIATFPTLATGTLLPAIRRWHERHPNLTVQLQEFRSRHALHEAVRTGAADLAIGIPPHDWKGPTQILGVNQFVLVLPPRDAEIHPESPVDLASFAQRQWVLYDQTYGLADLVGTIFALATIRPEPAVETSQAEAAARLAAAGLGPAIVPMANVPAELAAMVRTFEPSAYYEVYAFARRRWGASAREFLSIVREDPWPAARADAFKIEL